MIEQKIFLGVFPVPLEDEHWNGHTVVGSTYSTQVIM